MSIVKPNALVIYKSKCAIVSDVSGDKFTIRIAGGDSKSVRRKDIELLHPGPCNAVPAVPELPDAAAQAEIGELTGGESMPFAEFVELLMGKFTPETALAGFMLIAENCYFSGSVEGKVAANSAEHVAGILAKANARQAEAEAREALLERIRSGAVTTEDAGSLREIENVAYGETSASRLMRDLGIEATPEKAQSLLLKTGFWNEFDHNPWPRRFEVEINEEYPPWPAEFPDDEVREDLTALTAYAIDDAASTDPDDAISYDLANDLLWVHIADPAAVIKFGDELEIFASERGVSSYLPEKVTTMLPPEAVPMLGLGLQETSPALSFGLRIDADGHSHLEKLCLSRVRVKCLDYAGAEALADTPEMQAIAAALERFRAAREANNAVLIRLPEVKIIVDTASRDIKITPLCQNHIREMVANAMMAAGAAAAEFAVRNDFDLPFAIQPDPDIAERPESLSGMYELRKSCHPSTLSTIPGKHAGLGLEPYARVTSPLRRYEDLLSHIQLRRFLKSQPLLTAAELDERIASAQQGAVIRGKLERQCKEYWTLVYLLQHPDEEYEAVLAAKPDDRSVWLIGDLAYEFKNRFGGRIALGETVKVKFLGGDAALLTNQFKILQA